MDKQEGGRMNILTAVLFTYVCFVLFASIVASLMDFAANRGWIPKPKKEDE